ncbi:MAG: DUF6377 domain-containing protein [Bacteroidota bacterium]|nr:DUF6377 domain-containing protein [Bacteroidota bacterium]
MMSSALKITSSKKIYILILFISFSNVLFSHEDFPSLLLRLDSTIEKSNSYTQKREKRIENYKKELRKVKPFSISEYKINSLLYKEYKPYICDSAIFYQNKNIEIAIRLHDKNREDESKLEQAYLMGSIGLYKEAVDLLEGIDQSRLSNLKLIDYYNTHLRVYGELAFYTQDKRESKIYWKVFDAKLISLKAAITPENPLYLQLKEDSARNAHKFDEALKLNQISLSTTPFGTPKYALVTFRRSMIYQWQGNRDKQKYYLALSAISDIRSAIKDQASLMILAQILYEEGDIDRAYNYIRFSWNATMFYNAKLRSLQSSSILSLIDKTYQAKIEKQKTKLQYYLILTSSLLILLVFALFIIYKQIKRLSTAKRDLQLANADLNHLNAELIKLNDELTSVNQILNRTNNELSESNTIKEVYIGRFIELCSTYINKIDDFRKKVHNKIKDGKINDAKLMTQSQDIMDEEFNELYANFDNTFLQLFPDFVGKVNELLNENDRFVLKKGELLNPELRIIALMRLGISDGSKISQFMRYSLTTVYNYRTKTKNRTYLPKEEFDNKILQIR